MVADLSKLSFVSESRYEYTALKSHASFSVTAFGVKTIVIPHNLGYVPYFKGSYTYDNETYLNLFSGTTSFGIGGNGGQIDTITVNTSSISIEISENSGSPIAGTIYYRIYAEPQT